MVSFRFKVIAYLATVNAALFYFIFREQPGQIVAVFITLIGILSVVVLYLLDRRTRELFEICIKSGQEIEDLAGIPNNSGIYQKLGTRKLGRWSHGLVIRDTSRVIVLIWIAVLIISLCWPKLLNIHP